MNKEKLLVTLVAVLAIMNVVLIAFMLRGPHPNEGPRPEDDVRKEERVKKAFGFDDEQMNLFRQSRDKVGKSIRPVYDQLQELSQTYYTSSPQDTLRAITLAQIDSLTNLIYAINLTHFDEIKSICKPGQEKALDGLIRNIMNGEGRPHRRPRPN